MVLWMVAHAAPVELADPGSERSLVFDARLDVPLLVVGTAGGLTMLLHPPGTRATRSQSTFVDPPLTYGMPYRDRIFGDVRFRPDVSSARFSDAALITIPLLAVTVPTADVFRPGGLTRALGRKAIVYEAIALTVGLTSLGKLAVQRPRPYTLYAQDPSWQGPNDLYGADVYDVCTVELGCTFRAADAFWSFPSGHTSVVTAAGVAWVTTEILASDERGWRWLALSVPLTAGAVVGMARVEAGKHRPSDVAVGWALGAAVGLAVPWVHTRGVSIGGGPGDVGMSVQGTW